MTYSEKAMSDKKTTAINSVKDKDKHSDALIPASTVILLRETNGSLETLLLRRNAKLNFAGGNWVFPGGRVDPDDRSRRALGPLLPQRRLPRRSAAHGRRRGHDEPVERGDAHRPRRRG